MRAIIIIFFMLIAFDAQSKRMPIPLQERLNWAAKRSNTIFIGRVLEQKTIKGGFVANGGIYGTGIVKVEVLKVYRGKLVKGEQRLVCSWFDEIENTFGFDDGSEALFFGVDTGVTIQLPTFFGYVRSSTGNKKELARALKLPSLVTKDPDLIPRLSSGIILDLDRNACNEADVWEKGQLY